MPSFKGNPRTQRHKILSRKTRDLEAAHVKDFVILVPGCDGRTDRQMDGRLDDG